MKIGKYEIQNELGRGAMGTVYKAWDPLLDRYVAIKVISGDYAEKLRSLFEREAKSVAKMSDPNIITIYDFNYINDRPHIVMELLNGANLEDLAKNTSLEFVQKLEIISHVLRGLTHAHDQNVIHRDIKPSNIFVTDAGTAKIMDFGIARLTTGTQTHALLGTPEYMSPEQITGETLDGRTDLFAVGTLLYWLFSGSSPFSADGVHSILHNILNRVPPPLNLPEFTPDQMREFQAIVDRALEKKAADRYQRASEMNSDLEAFLKKLKETGMSETLPLKERVKKVAAEVEKQRSSQASPDAIRTAAGDSFSEPTTFEGTLQLGGKKPPTLAPPPQYQTDGSSQARKSPLAAILGVLAVIALAVGGYFYFFNHENSNGKQASESAMKPTAAALPTKRIELNLAYGSDKQGWLQDVVSDFEKSSNGQKFKINLMPLGYSEASDALLSGKSQIHVWWPTSTLPEELLSRKWVSKYGEKLKPVREETALTTSIFLMWEERYIPFIKKYKKVSFATINQAMWEKNGWGAIAGKPEWGLLGFGYADPKESNTGLMMIQLMTNEFYHKADAITVKDIENPQFQTFMKSFRKKSKTLGRTTEESIQEMIRKGPATYDVVFVNENVAIEYFRQAEDRWGKFRVIYPEYNMWNENPYYVINAPWVSEEHRQAAEAFLNFASENEEQAHALKNGFRPADTSIPIRGPESPFVLLQSVGLQFNLGTTCEYPNADALTALLKSWENAASNSVSDVSVDATNK